MRHLLLIAAAAVLIGAAPAKKLTPNDIVSGSPASAWKTIPADNLLVMDLANGGRVVVQLAPAFAPVHVANIKALSRGGLLERAPPYRPPEKYFAPKGPYQKGKTRAARGKAKT